ncbi:hypothetical protein [Streptacidiphilus rugosus]|uniref:hypothetical protein n=1 Tax=Streptacidiphilus rugosus TaxID=405783 RepID=UPI00056AE6FA|nr:hypothetical protein [Streptacidiphilus rugosus]
MTVVEQLSAVLEPVVTAEPAENAEPLAAPGFLGADPGEGETWEITRFLCPDCHRPIAVLDNEERFPQHAVVATPWHPFSAALCQGSGRWLDDAESEEEQGFDPEPSLAEFLTLPAELDWRRQPFSHVGGPGSKPLSR